MLSPTTFGPQNIHKQKLHPISPQVCDNPGRSGRGSESLLQAL